MHQYYVFKMKHVHCVGSQTLQQDIQNVERPPSSGFPARSQGALTPKRGLFPLPTSACSTYFRRGPGSRQFTDPWSNKTPLFWYISVVWTQDCWGQAVVVTDFVKLSSVYGVDSCRKSPLCSVLRGLWFLRMLLAFLTFSRLFVFDVLGLNLPVCATVHPGDAVYLWVCLAALSSLLSIMSPHAHFIYIWTTSSA